MYQDSTIVFVRFIQKDRGMIEEESCFRPIQTIQTKHYYAPPRLSKIFKIDRPSFCDSSQMVKNPFHVFLIDIDTILPKFHSCFLVDTDLISMISKNLLDGSSSSFGAHLFQYFQKTNPDF